MLIKVKIKISKEELKRNMKRFLLVNFIFTLIIFSTTFLLSSPEIESVMWGLLLFWLPHLVISEYLIFSYYSKPTIFYPTAVTAGGFLLTFFVMATEYFIARVLLSGFGHAPQLSDLNLLYLLIFLLIVWIPPLVALSKSPFLRIFKTLIHR